MSDLQVRLEAALGDTYRIEKELGGGGMSFVFLAEETELGRRVVIKVLPPDMSAGVNKERFQREIKLAASLQHPHVVPLLTAGTADGDLLYYVMPYIEGESLRAKLAREVELPVGEALKILREVVDALAYAHRNEVVHRDIKPDNVLLSEGHAVVTDFGVAKAVSASSGGTASGLTSLGMALGTPAYMSPEQAAADPHVDHRADIYALGALAYEMLAGQTPFIGNTAQQLLAAHVSQTPEPVTRHRTAVPPALADMIMRCLEKKAADRWQTADELRTQLDAMATPQSGGVTPTSTQPVAAMSSAEIEARHHPVRVAALFGVAAAAVLGVVYGLMIALGLPNWVFLGAVILLAIGLPILLVTGQHEKRRAVAVATGLHTATPVGLGKHFTWRKAISGGGAAFAALTVVATGYMGMRGLGIGPAATLASAGTIGEREPIVLTQLDNRTPDSTLGSTITELLRVSLSQSSFIKLVDPARLSESLGRMQRDPNTPVDESIGLEIAEREGIKAVLSGDVVPLGDGFVISSRLLAADGTVLTAHQASANNAGEVMTAIDKVAAQLREKMGESLKTIRRTAPLDLVTTGSLEALRLYTQAVHAEIAGDDERAIDLLDQAIRVDTTFAMAYRKLGIILGNRFEQRARAVDALTKAYEFRDRLTDIERGYATAMYHSRVTGERGNVIAAYRTILDQYPDDFRALNNTGVTYGQLNDFERALEFYSRALAMDSTWSPGFLNVNFAQRALGRFDDASATLDAMETRFPGNPNLQDFRGAQAFGQGEFQTAQQHWQELLERERASLFWRAEISGNLAGLAAMRGQLAEARRYGRDALSATEQRGLAGDYLITATSHALFELQLGQDPNRAAVVFQPAYQRTALSELAVPDRPYEVLAQYFALIGNARGARETVSDMEASGIAELGRGFERQYRRALAWAELAEGNHKAALDNMRQGNAEWGCLGCRLMQTARFFDATGQADSAIVYWERYVETPWRVVFLDATGLPTGYRRLGELYEADGNREKAVEYYNQFVELWSEADPELQGQVTEVRNRIAKLVGEGR